MTNAKPLLPLLFLLLLTACTVRSGRMLRQLEHLEEMNRSGQPLQVDSVLTLVRHYDHWWHPSLLRLRAYYMLGSAYRDQGEAPAALHYYNIAVQQADTTQADSATAATLFRVYGQMALIYEQQDLPRECLEALNHYENYALKAHDTLSYIIGMERKISPYYLLDDSLQVFSLTDSVRKMYLERGLGDYAARVCATAMYISLLNADYPRSLYYMKNYEEDPSLFDEKGKLEVGRELYYYIKGGYFEGINKLDSAQYYYREALRYKLYYEGYKGLFSIYKKLKNADSIVKYSTLQEEALIKLTESRQAEAIIQSSAMYNYERNQRIAIESTQKAEWLKLLGGFIFTIALFAIFIIYQYYKNRVQEQEAKIRELDRQYTSASKEYVQLVEEFQIIKQEYDNSENSKNSKEAKDLIEKKQNRIIQLEGMLSKYQADLNLLRYTERENLLKDNEIVTYFVEKARITPNWKAPEEENWKSLSDAYNQYMPLASAHMEKAGLSRQEHLTCILTHLNFIPSDIATLLDTGNSRISNVKKTASKKLFGDEESKKLRQRIIAIECRDNKLLT